MAAKQPGGRKDPPHQKREAPATEALIAAARAMYESIPGATFDLLAKELNTNAPRIRQWKLADARRGVEWKRNAFKAIPQLSEKAHELANTFTARMSERGVPMSDEVAKQEAAQELAETHAVQQRAEILHRHRGEWMAPRKIAYDAIKSNDFEKAKLAKITSETLTLIQAGECRAYGIDTATRAAGGGTVVVVDRNEQRTVEAEAGEAADSIQMPAEVENTPATGPVVGNTETEDVF